MRKRFFYLFMALAVLLSFAPATLSFAAEGDQVTAPANVALGKGATSVGDINANDVIANVFDGNPATYWTASASSGGAPSFTVNLSRRYIIEEIVIMCRNAAHPDRAEFELWGSNSAEGDFVKFYDINVDANADATLFPLGGSLTISKDSTVARTGAGETSVTTENGFLEEKPTYQYIKYQAKVANICYIPEFEVKANQTTTELANGSYAISPDVYDAVYDKASHSFTLPFSEEMNTTTINADSVKLYKADGTPVAYTSITPSGSEAVIALPETVTGGDYYITADNTITNTAGTPLKAAAVQAIIPVDEVSGLLPATTKLVNVAKNQTVTVSDGSGAAKLVDGDLRYTSVWVASGTAATDSTPAVAPWAMIDLGRRYPIEKIVLFDDAGRANRQRFRIYGSDDVNFATKEELHYEDVTEDLTFPSQSGYVITLTNKPVYRYIRYEALDVYEVKLREIQVYASVTAGKLDLSNSSVNTTRNSNGTSGVEDVSGARQIVDGTYYAKYINQWNAAQRVSTSGNVYQTITVDMGSDIHLNLIELYGGFYNQNLYANGVFKIYGSRNAVTTDLYSGTTTIDDAGTTKHYGELTPDQWIAQTANDYTEIDPGVEIHNSGLYTGRNEEVTWPQYILSDGSAYEPFPMNKDKTDETGWTAYQATQNPANAYRYLTYRKTSAQLLTLNEMEAYVFHPEAYSITANANTATIALSDYNINPATVSKMRIKLYKAGAEEEVAYTSVALSGADAVITFDKAQMESGAAYTVVVDDLVNTYGVAMAEAEELTFTYKDWELTNLVTDVELTEDADCGLSFTLTNNGLAARNVAAIVAVYNGNQLLGVKTDQQQVEAGQNAAFSASLTPTVPAGVTPAIRVYIWDMNTFKPLMAAEDVSQ